MHKKKLMAIGIGITIACVLGFSFYKQQQQEEIPVAVNQVEEITYNNIDVLNIRYTVDSTFQITSKDDNMVLMQNDEGDVVICGTYWYTNNKEEVLKTVQDSLLEGTDADIKDFKSTELGKLTYYTDSITFGESDGQLSYFVLDDTIGFIEAFTPNGSSKKVHDEIIKTLQYATVDVYKTSQGLPIETKASLTLDADHTASFIIPADFEVTRTTSNYISAIADNILLECYIEDLGDIEKHTATMNRVEKDYIVVATKPVENKGYFTAATTYVKDADVQQCLEILQPCNDYYLVYKLTESVSDEHYMTLDKFIRAMDL